MSWLLLIWIFKAWNNLTFFLLIGRCLEKMGVHVVDTVDSSGLPTFLPFSPEELLFPRQSQTAGHIRKINDPLANSENWYWKSLWSPHQLVMINLKVTIVRFTAIIRENLDHYWKKINWLFFDSILDGVYDRFLTTHVVFFFTILCWSTWRVGAVLYIIDQRDMQKRTLLLF